MEEVVGNFFALALREEEEGESWVALWGVVGSADENTMDKSRDAGELQLEDGAGEDTTERGLGVTDGWFSVAAGGDTNIRFLFFRNDSCFFLRVDDLGLFLSSACSTSGVLDTLDLPLGRT